jgi:hypothetical protein
MTSNKTTNPGMDNTKKIIEIGQRAKKIILGEWEPSKSGMPVEKLVAKLQLEYGWTRKKIQEILHLLVIDGQIDVAEGGIYYLTGCRDSK